MPSYRAPVRDSLLALAAATRRLMQHALGRPAHGAAASMAYLHLMGLVALGYLWARMAAALAGGPDEASCAHKLATARHYFAYPAAETAVHRARVEAGADPLMALPAEAF